MYIYHALINPLSAHIIHIHLNTIFYTHLEHSPTETIYIRYYMETHTHTHNTLIIQAQNQTKMNTWFVQSRILKL